VKIPVRNTNNGWRSPTTAELGEKFTQQRRERLKNPNIGSDACQTRRKSATTAEPDENATLQPRDGVKNYGTVSSIFPLLCIWFPDTLGTAASSRINKPSPAWLVWVLGWVVLLLPAIAVGIIWLRTP